MLLSTYCFYSISEVQIQPRLIEKNMPVVSFKQNYITLILACFETLSKLNVLSVATKGIQFCLKTDHIASTQNLTSKKCSKIVLTKANVLKVKMAWFFSTCVFKCKTEQNSCYFRKAIWSVLRNEYFKIYIDLCTCTVAKVF